MKDGWTPQSRARPCCLGWRSNRVASESELFSRTWFRNEEIGICFSLHVSRTSWYYLILFAVAFVGDILPGAIPNASVPFGIPIAILLRWLLAEWLGLQVSAQLPWWSLMELDQRRSNFSSIKTFYKIQFRGSRQGSPWTNVSMRELTSRGLVRD